MKIMRFILVALCFSANIDAVSVQHLCTCALEVQQTKEWKVHFKKERHDDVMNLSLTLREDGRVAALTTFPQFGIEGSFDFLKSVEFVRNGKVDVYVRDSSFIDILCYVPGLVQQTFQVYKNAGPIKSINLIETNTSCDLIAMKFQENVISLWVIDYYNLYKVSLVEVRS